MYNLILNMFRFKTSLKDLKLKVKSCLTSKMSVETSVSKLFKDFVINAARESKADINDSSMPLSNVLEPRNKLNTFKKTNENSLTRKKSLQNADALKSYVKDSVISLTQNLQDTCHKNKPSMPLSEILSPRNEQDVLENTLQGTNSTQMYKNSTKNVAGISGLQYNLTYEKEIMVPLSDVIGVAG